MVLIFLSLRAHREGVDAEAILALPLSPRYDVSVTGGQRRPDGSVAPYYVVSASCAVYQTHGGTIVDVGDLRIVCPVDLTPFWEHSRSPVTSSVVIESNALDTPRSGGGGGHGRLRFYSHLQSGTSTCEVQIVRGQPEEVAWSLEFTVRDRDLTVQGQTLRIGVGHRVVFLDTEGNVVRVESVNNSLAEIDMTPVTEFGGTWEALKEVHERKFRVKNR